MTELQMQYSNFKDTLQNIASQIGNVEQEVEEHKYVARQLLYLQLFLMRSRNSMTCPVRQKSINVESGPQNWFGQTILLLGSWQKQLSMVYLEFLDRWPSDVAILGARTMPIARHNFTLPSVLSRLAALLILMTSYPDSSSTPSHPFPAHANASA
jgi:hypothetical protein